MVAVTHMHKADITYRVAPSWNDGYSVTVQLDGGPVVHVYVEKLKFADPASDPEWGYRPVPSHRPVGQPRVVMPDSDVKMLGSALAAVNVPLLSPSVGPTSFDGVVYELAVSSPAYTLEISWSDSLPNDLANLGPPLALLDEYARKSLCSRSP